MRNIKLMVTAAFVLYFLNGLFGPLLVVFIQNIGGDDLLNIGYVYATFIITSGIFGALSGKVSDKHGRRKLILLGAGLAIIVPFSYIFATTVYHILAIEFISGISLGIMFSPFLALYSESTKKGKRGFHFGLYDLLTSVASGIATLLGVYVAEFFGFANLFMIMGALSVANFIILTYVEESMIVRR